MLKQSSNFDHWATASKIRFLNCALDIRKRIYGVTGLVISKLLFLPFNQQK